MQYVCVSCSSYQCYCEGEGVVKAFSLVLRNETLPNTLLPNVMRSVITVNGTIPGPAIVVDEGDLVEVLVSNVNIDAGTAVHWHGMVQYGSPFSDGVLAVTQCAIPAGSSVTYKFRASLPGTYWYHGHHVEQYVDGLVGALIVNRLSGARRDDGAPVGADERRTYNYSEDVTFVIQDYYNNEAHKLTTDYFLTPSSGGDEPVPDAILVNGLASGRITVGVERRGASRFRFIAANALSTFVVSIDGAALSVIEIDGTATRPFAVSQVELGPGQRVSLLVDWRSVPSNVTGVYLRVTATASANESHSVPFYESDAINFPTLNVPGAMPRDMKHVSAVTFVANAGVNYAATERLSGVTPLATPVDGTGYQFDALPLDALRAPDATHFAYSEIAFYNNSAGVNLAQ